MGVIFTTLLLMAFIMASSLSAVGFSRQRTEATALANQALEQIRALPASQLYMSATDLSDAQLVACGAGTCFNTRTVPLANFGANPATTPLTPHISGPVTAAPGNTQYTIKSYLTVDPTDASGHTLVATVQVSWSNSQKGAVGSSLQVESKIYNAQFKETPPTIHNFTASATGVPGSISVTGTVLGQSLANTVFSLPGSSAAMNGTSLPNSTNVGASGSPVVSAGIAQSGVTAGATTVLNTPAASATAFSTPSTNTSGVGQTDNKTPTIAPGLPGGLTGGAVGTLTGSVSVGATVAASAEAASAAAGATPTPGSPTLPSNGLGFGQGTASQTGPVGANLNVVSLLGLPVLGIGLVNVIPAGNANPDYSKVVQGGSTGSPQTQTFNAEANAQFTEIDIATLSLLGLTLPGSPLIKLTGFKQTAYACAGPVACTPTAPVDTGSISILGQPPVTIQNLLAGVPLAPLNTALLSPVNLGAVTLGVTGTGITLGPAPTSGSVASPITINLNLDASVGLTSLLHVTINVNLGSVQASASYS